LYFPTLHPINIENDQPLLPVNNGPLESSGRHQISPDKTTPVVPKISELIVSLLYYYKTVAAATTVKDAIWVIEGHLIHFFGIMQPRQITPAIIENYKQKPHQ